MPFSCVIFIITLQNAYNFYLLLAVSYTHEYSRLALCKLLGQVRVPSMKCESEAVIFKHCEVLVMQSRQLAVYAADLFI